MDRDHLARLTMDAIAFAVMKDAERASVALDEIGMSGDHFHMYAACCAFASVARDAMVKVFGYEPDLTAGDMWALEELEPGGMADDPAKTFAVRFIVAYANDDKETAPALFRAALEAGPDQFTESVCALLGNAADLHRLGLEHSKKDGQSA
ncbi:hypothetical protein [Streptomyces sp. NPDC002547]